MIVDFAIIAQHEPAIVTCHGLVPRGRQVDDRQSTMGKRDPGIGIDPIAVAIRTAMNDGIGHATQYRLAVRKACPIQEPCKATHQFSLFSIE